MHFFLFNCSLSHFDLRCVLHSYKIIWIYLSIYTSTCRSIYRNCLRFECSVVISKCWQRKTKHETWNLCMWLIPFQSRFLFIFVIRIKLFFFQFIRRVFFYSSMIVVIVVVVVWLLNKWQAIQCYCCLQLHCIFQIFSFILCVFFFRVRAFGRSTICSSSAIEKCVSILNFIWSKLAENVKRHWIKSEIPFWHMVTGCLFIDSFQTDLIGRFYICIILSFILINVISAQSDWYLVFSSSFGFFSYLCSLCCCWFINAHEIRWWKAEKKEFFWDFVVPLYL